MSMSGPTPPTAIDPYNSSIAQSNLNTGVAAQQKDLNTQTAQQQQDINTGIAKQQQDINASTAALQNKYNTGTAAQQEVYNVGNATANQAGSMVNQSNPFGSLSWQQSGTGAGGVPLYTSKVGLNPTLQGVVDSLMGQSNDLLKNANYGGTGTSPGDIIGNMTSGATKNMLDKWSGIMQPQFDYSRDRLDTQLKNQGFNQGTPGYDKAMNALMFDQGQQKNSFMLQAEPTAYNQATQSYGLPLALASQEMGLIDPSFFNKSLVNAPGLNIGNPNISATPVANAGVGGTTVNPTTVNPTDFNSSVANYNNAMMAPYNAKVAANGNMMSGLFGIPSSMLGGWAKGGFAIPGMAGAGAAGAGAAEGAAAGETLAAAGAAFI